MFSISPTFFIYSLIQCFYYLAWNFIQFIMSVLISSIVVFVIRRVYSFFMLYLHVQYSQVGPFNEDVYLQCYLNKYESTS